jgi:hypothetical protein
VLRAAGVVRTRRQSQVIWYELALGPANHVVEAPNAAFCALAASQERLAILSGHRSAMTGKPACFHACRPPRRWAARRCPAAIRCSAAVSERLPDPQ